MERRRQQTAHWLGVGYAPKASATGTKAASHYADSQAAAPQRQQFSPADCARCRQYWGIRAWTKCKLRSTSYAFREAFLEKKGTEFQDWFVKLALHAFGPDFEAVGTYGRSGDLKCDGRRISTNTIFQCYAPYQRNEQRLNAKIRDDFCGAYEHWPGMAKWVLVYNDTQGLPPSSSQLIDHLRHSHPEVRIEVWAEPKLQELAAGLALDAQQAIFGFAPSKTGMETLMLDDIKPVIDVLQQTDPEPGEEPLTPPSVNKLAKNSLSEDAAGLLQIGRRKEGLVEIWFSKSPNADLGERIAEAFRRSLRETKGHWKIGGWNFHAPSTIRRHRWRAEATERGVGCSFIFLRAVRYF